jgi:threonine aldolase
MPLTPEQREALRLSCTRQFSGHPVLPPGEELARVGAWCREHGHQPDRYGESALIQAFESKICALLGKEAAVFMPSGTMAQQIALRIWSERARFPHFGMHPTCHLELHEEHGYAHLHGLKSTFVGPVQKPMLASDLAGCAEALSALLIELPIREAGGQLQTWDQLRELLVLARQRNIRTHMDGARLWETSSYFDKNYAEICAGFDSVYVSFYKGIGAFAGAMLLGPADFIAEARVWRRRHGGTLVQMVPMVASAAMRFDAQLANMPAYFKRAQALAEAVKRNTGIVVNPDPIQTNLFHLHFQTTPEALADARDRIAAEQKIWMAGRAVASGTPGWSMSEIYVGENLMAMSDDEALALLSELAGRRQPAV